MKALLYVRTAHQDKYAEQSQLEQLRRHADRLGYEIVGEIIESGVSGTTLDRAGIHQMEDEVSRRNIDFVLAVKHSRIARRLEDYLALEAVLRSHGTVLTYTQV